MFVENTEENDATIIDINDKVTPVITPVTPPVTPPQSDQTIQHNLHKKAKRWLNYTAQFCLALLLISLVIFFISLFTNNEIDNITPNLEDSKKSNLLSLISSIQRKLPNRSHSSLKKMITSREFESFNDFCDMKHQNNCDIILSFLRKDVIPLMFKESKNYRNASDVWKEARAISLSKKVKKTTPYTHSVEGVVVTSGDDSMVFGENFFIISDGVSSNQFSAYLSKNIILLTDSIIPAILSATTSIERSEEIIGEMMELLQEIVYNLHLEGGATFSIGVRKDPRTIVLGTLGDSEIKILRGEKLAQIWSSPFQRMQRQNIPGQINGRNEKIIQEYNVETFTSLQENDIIVAASDGLWDNMRVLDVSKNLLKRSIIDKNFMNSLMDKVVKKRNGKWESSCDFKRCYGGHVDDISIFVAKV